MASGFPEQVELGSAHRFTQTISSAPIGANSVWLSVYHRFLGPTTKTAVASVLATEGDSATLWNADITAPSSAGIYLAEWTAVNTIGSVTISELFEVVQTQAAEGTGPLYATPEQLLRRYPVLMTLKSRSMEEWRGYIERAQRQIDSRLAGRFTVPLGSQNSGDVPPRIEDLTLAGAWAYYQDDNKPGATGFGRLYDRFVGDLNSLADGSVTLVTSAGGLVATVSTDEIFSTTQDYTPTFGVGDGLDEEVDPDRIDDEEDAR